jgi:hypothetical protein
VSRWGKLNWELTPIQERIDDLHRLATAASLWPSPAVSTDVGGFILLVFTEDNVPTWEVRRKAKKVDGREDDLVVGGTADTFDAAKAAALFEATAGPGNDDTV